MKKRFLLISLPLFTTLQLGAVDNIFMSFKYGLSSLSDTFSLQKHTFGLDLTVDTGNNIKPKFDFSYVNISEGNGGVDYLLQGSANILYESNEIYLNAIVPYAYAGLGYEYVNNERPDFKSSPYVQLAGGLEFPFFGYQNDDFKFFTEARWIQLITTDSGQEGEAAVFVGFRLSTGGMGHIAEHTYGAYDGDNLLYPELSVKTPSNHVFPKRRSTHLVFSDADGDGVRDSMDICPNTRKDTVVDIHGCPVTYKKPAIHRKPMVVSKRHRRVTFKPLPSHRKTLAVQFEPNSTTIQPSSKTLILNFVRGLNDKGYQYITVEGYTDNSGKHGDNVSLSLKRAQAVKRLMIQYGVDSAKIQAVGKGELNPIADNDTPEGRAKNRRIEIVVE